MQHRQTKQRENVNQTAHIVLLDTMQTRANNGVLAKWMRITLRHGVKAAQLI